MLDPSRKAKKLLVLLNALAPFEVKNDRSKVTQNQSHAQRGMSGLTALIAGFVVLCAVERAIAAALEGFTGDEAYTLVVARNLALSYFDHPPLHQWILHGAVALVGEGRFDRAPFLLAVIAINAPLFGLTRRLYDRTAALWALFAFNATVYFMLWPDGLIMPDTLLLLFLAVAIWLVAEILFAPPITGSGRLALWLAAGLALGLAGLSKYSAIFAPLGVFAFLLGSPRHRFWLRRPEPYLGAALALAIFSPALIWNAEHHWASFTFQSARAGKHFAFDVPALVAVANAVGAQVASISPWVGVPLVVSLVIAARSRDAEGGDRFLLWLVAPAVLLFAVLPFAGQRTIPHWFNSGWLFAFPLLGRWLSVRRPPWLSGWALSSAALTTATMALYVAFVTIGPFWWGAVGPIPAHDPTEWSYDWRGLGEAAAWRASGPSPPTFILVENWRVGGKAGVAIGPSVAVCDFSRDPREFAFLCDPRSKLGQDALIVVPEDRAASFLSKCAPYFESIDANETVAVGRAEHAERRVTLARGHKLLRPFPQPYGFGS
jgi:4-amino-4-deoxy-L-arabinose transferase-like glycosyltransferase